MQSRSQKRLSQGNHLPTEPGMPSAWPPPGRMRGLEREGWKWAVKQSEWLSRVDSRVATGSLVNLELPFPQYPTNAGG